MSSQLETKRALHEAFWRDEGPSLMFIPPGLQELYDLSLDPYEDLDLIATGNALDDVLQELTEAIEKVRQ